MQTGVAASRIAATATGVDVTCGGMAMSFDGVVVAAPAPSLAQIDFDFPGAAGIAAIATMPMASIASVSLGYRRDQVAHALDASRLLVPSIERRAILSAVLPSSVFDGRAPADHVLLTGYVGGARRPDLVEAGDAALVAVVHGEFAALLGVRGGPVMQEVAVWRDALPQAVAGHGSRLAAADAVEAAGTALAFTGAWRDGLSIGEVLLGGMHAAGRLLDRLGWRQPGDH